MGSHGSKETGLDYLLGLDGNIEFQNDAGDWVKMEVSRVAVTVERPHGIKYSLTWHAPDSTRLIGFDNAHGGVKPEGSRFLHAGKKYAYDHRHRHADDAEVDRVLKEVSQ